MYKERKKQEKIITGIYNQNQNSDFGFVDIEGKEKGYYVFAFNRNNALDGDKVIAKIKVFKGREEAVILEVLKRTDKTFIGEFKISKNKNFGFVVLKNNAIKKDIFIPGKYIKKAKDKDIVGIKIIKWIGKNPEGKIVENIGKSGDRDIDVRGFILEAGFKENFSREVIKEVEKFKNKKKNTLNDSETSSEGQNKQVNFLDKKELKNRKDLRELFTFTIDGKDAKDLDDAISVKQKENGDYRLFVHIADVTHYIKEKSLLDKEALKRATSVYLPDKVLPMLPKILSNNLCSLNPDITKLALTCEMIISKNGELKKTLVYESIIKSDFRLTYSEVDEIILENLKENDNLTFKKKLDKNLIKTLLLADNLKNSISKYRENSGVLDFDFPEIKLEIDENKQLKSIKKYPKYKSNKLIEKFMVTCNEAISRKFFNYPFLYRIHEKPKQEDIEKLQKTLDLFDINFKLKVGSTKELSDLLSLLSKLKDKKLFLENTILRTLSKAIYSLDNLGHFGLGLKYYSHFTSPIRRYPDLQIHRIIKEKLSGKLYDNRILHYKNILDKVAKKSSEQERKAEKLEYKIRDYYIVKYYKDKVGERFEAIITNMIPIGFFVQLENSVEGFIENKKDYNLKEDRGTIENLKTGKIYKLGEKIKVELIEADQIKIRLNFKMI